MKKTKKNIKSKSPQSTGPMLAINKTNYIIFAIALVFLIVGYVFLSIGPADSFESLTVAPIILVIGYVVLIPLAIFWRKKTPAPTQQNE